MKYENFFKEYGVVYLKTFKDVKQAYKNKTLLWCTKCSKTKNTNLKELSYAKDIYVADTNLNFYAVMQKLKSSFAIISDYYGLFYHTEKRSPLYNVHPSDLTEEKRKQLGQVIKAQLNSKSYESVVFYGTSPLMSKPYLEMLAQIEKPIYYVSNIKLIKQLYFKQLI